MLSPNTILQNRYRIVRQLGQGGMGTVYEALDQRLNSLVAIKETHLTTEEARRAFEREASLLANLSHRSLPSVTDHFAENDSQYLVMKFIPGNDLAQMLEARQSPFAVGDVLTWADEILTALEYLHGHNPPILHRDMKPSNLKLTADGELFLLDFGLAKGAAGQMPTLLTSRSVKGYTPVYSPLEQIHGGGTDPRSDLYALAATLYHLMTGVAPVDAPARFVALDDLQQDPLPAADELNAEVPHTVAAVLKSAMAMNRRHRPASAAEMRRLLREAKNESVPAATAEEHRPSVELAPTAPAAAPDEDALQVSPPSTIPSERARKSSPTTIPAPAPEFAKAQVISASHPRTAEARRTRAGIVALLIVVLSLVGVIGVIISSPGILRRLRGSNANDEPVNSSGGQLASVTTPPSSPSPLPKPATVKVRIRIVDELMRQDTKTASPTPNATVTIRVDGKVTSHNTDRQGNVTFEDVPCGEDIQITFPRFDYDNPDANRTWTIKRNIACDNPMANLGTYFTASGTTVGKY